MSAAEKSARVKRGDVQTDRGGSRWIVTRVEYDGPRPICARVREGSLAARTIFPNR